MILALAAQKNIEIGQFDVKMVFLNGYLIREIVFINGDLIEIYMKIPKGVTTEYKNKVCRLRKSLYGLTAIQASRSWNCKFDSFLNRFQFVPSKADTCVYADDYNSDKIYLIIYVDDGLILASSKETNNVVLNHLKSGISITIDDVKEYIGIEIIRDIEAKTIFIHQVSYVKRVLHKFNMVDSKVKSIPMDLDMNLFAANE